MSDLLRIGASGVTAYRTALSVIGENVANSETQGYARRDVTLREITTGGSGPLYRSSLTGGGGVLASSVNRAWDEFKAGDARAPMADAGSADTRVQWLGAIETALPTGDNGVTAKLNEFFAAANKLAADPTSPVVRSTTLTALGDAVDAIKSGANGLARVSAGIGAEAQSTAASVNGSLESLAKLNQALAKAANGSSAKAGLADQRDRLLDDIAGKIGIDAKVGADGTATVSLAGAGDALLVSGSTASKIDLAVADDGRVTLALSGQAITPGGGSLAGLIGAAATTADARTSLDKLAVDFTASLNSWQARGTTPAGAAGKPLLAIGTGAATLALASTEPGSIAAATNGSANGNLTGLADLRGSDGVEARLTTLVALNAQALAGAKAEASAAGSRRDAALVARDDVSGVDLDREAAELIRYQQAYDGSAKVIQVARETLQTILQLF